MCKHGTGKCGATAAAYGGKPISTLDAGAMLDRGLSWGTIDSTCTAVQTVCPSRKFVRKFTEQSKCINPS